MSTSSKQKNPSEELKANTADAIDSRRLQVFLEAARGASFSAAAQALGMVPSAVSHAIKTLEEEFQCSLFKRRGPRVSLTKAGIRLLPLAEELLQRMHRLREEIVVLKGRSQHLRVMMPEVFCAYKLPEILPDFMECFPSAIFEVASGDCDSSAALDALDDGEIDLLFSYREHEEERVVKRGLFTEEVGFYVAPFHAFSSFPPSSLEKLGGHPLLVSDPLIEAQLNRLLRGFDVTARVWRLPSVQTVLELAKSGQGVALLPGWLTDSIVGDSGLISLSVGDVELKRTCSIYRSSKMELSWSAEVFTNLAAMIAEKE